MGKKKRKNKPQLVVDNVKETKKEVKEETKATEVTTQNWLAKYEIQKEEKKKKHLEMLTKDFIKSESCVDADKTFEKLCNFSQDQLYCSMRDYLQKYYPKENVICTTDYIIAKGTVPVMLVAHLDMVNKESPKQFYYKRNNTGIVTTPTGIGGDDRCGIYMIREIVKETNCWVMLCKDEEIGCVGARKFKADIEKKLIAKEEFKDLKFILELDRRGKDDCVFYDLDSSEFEDFIEKESDYFKTNYGSCSDISYIAPALGIAAANLSVGYQDEHSIEETVDLHIMKGNIVYVKKLIDAGTKLEKPFEYKEIIYKGKYGYDYGSYGYGSYGSYYDDYTYQTGQKCLEEYDIYFEDTDKAACRDYYEASSPEEALGMFMMNHPTLCYNDVIDIFITGDGYDMPIDRDYIEGEEIKYDERNAK